MNPQAWIEREQQRSGSLMSGSGSLAAAAGLGDGDRRLPAAPGGTTVAADGSVVTPAATTSQRSAREMGNDAFRRGLIDLALLHYNQAIEEEPSNELGYCNRAAVFQRMGRFEAAVDDARAAVRLKPGWFKGHYRLGVALSAVGQHDEAIGALQMALSLMGSAPDVADMKQEAEKQLAKCESKRVRQQAASTPLSKSLRPPGGIQVPDDGGSSSSFSHDGPKGTPMGGSPTVLPATPFAFPRPSCAAVPLSQAPEVIYRNLDAAQKRRDDLKNIAVDASTIRVIQQYDRPGREKRVATLLSRCDPETIHRAADQAHADQDALRRAVESSDRQVFQAALTARDRSLNHLYALTKESASAAVELRTLVDDERRSAAAIEAKLKAAGVTPLSAEEIVASETTAAAIASAAAACCGDAAGIPISSSSPGATTSMINGTTTVNYRDLAKRFLDIQTSIDAVTKPAVTATNSALVSLAEALQQEAIVFDQVSIMIDEQRGLCAQALRSASRIVNHQSLVSADKLTLIDAIQPMLRSLSAEEISFRDGNDAGKRLLTEESTLERERLRLERQRIHLQAELEWTLVQDDDDEGPKLNRLRHAIQDIKQQLLVVQQRQQDVQQNIVRLIHTDHPELGWRSAAASGNRAMKWIKGSGLWLNQSFSDFEILSTLASTINSKVYTARNRRGMLVALKEIPMESDKLRRRFQNEVNIVSGASTHPCIIRILGVFFDGPFAYLVMPFYANGSLHRYVGRLKDPLPPWRLQEIFRQIVSAVAFLHDRGIVHGDIKPTNILLADDLTPVISDFGLARDMGRYGERQDVTWVGTVGRGGPSAVTGSPNVSGAEGVSPTGGGVQVVGGTEAFMSPEMLTSSEPRPTARSDVWSLAITLHSVAAQNAAIVSNRVEELPDDAPVAVGSVASTAGSNRIAQNAASTNGHSTTATSALPATTSQGSLTTTGADALTASGAASSSSFMPSQLQFHIPILMPGTLRVSVRPDVVGNNSRLAELLTMALTVEPSQRPAATELLSHPYFTVSLLQDLVVNRQLIESNRKLDALHTYIHAVRSTPRLPTLMSVLRTKMVESVTSVFTELDENAIIGPLFVVFQGESGLDDGGLTAEMFTTYFVQAISKHKLLVTAKTADHAAQDSDEGPPDVLVPTANAAAAVGGTAGGPSADGGVAVSADGGPGNASTGANATSPAVAAAVSSSSAAVVPGTARPLPAIDYGSQYLLTASDHYPTSLFVALGRVLLKSIIEGRPAPVSLNASVVKFLLGIPPSIDDLEEFDRNLVRQLSRMTFMSDEELEVYDLEFSEFGAPFLQSFLPAGTTITPVTKVTHALVKDYIQCKVHYELVYRRRAALQSLKEGFFMSPILKPHLELLSPTELQMVLGSQAHLHAGDIIKSLEFVNFPPASNTPTQMIDLLKGLSQHNLRRFLRLCTSSLSVPQGGFPRKIKVLCTADVARLPVGHTCAMQLDLPDYNDAIVLRDKMAVALAHVNDGFHLA